MSLLPIHFEGFCLEAHQYLVVNTRAKKYPSLDSPLLGFKRSAEAAGLLDDTRTDQGANKTTRLDSQGRVVPLHPFHPPALIYLHSSDSARAGSKKPGEEAALAEDVRTDNVESQVAILQPQGCLTYSTSLV